MDDAAVPIRPQRHGAVEYFDDDSNVIHRENIPRLRHCAANGIEAVDLVG